MADMDATIPTAAAPERAKRYNSGKPRFDLIPPQAMLAVARVFQSGAEKYGDRNWMGSIGTADHDQFRNTSLASLMRHVNAYHRDTVLDDESLEHHMAHVIANALFIMTYDFEGGAV